MRKVCLGMAMVLFAAAAGAEETADAPFLVLQSGGHTAPVTEILFTSDGKEVLTVSRDKTVRLWDAGTGERLGVLRPPTGAGGTGGALNAIALSPDGKTLAAAGTGVKVGEEVVFRVFLIDLAGGSVRIALQGHKKNITCLAFSHDGKWVAAGGTDNVAYLWDATSGRLLHTLEGHKDLIGDLAFSPNDRLLATGSYDHTARLWSVETGQAATGPLAHEGAVHCVAWKDNYTLATSGGGLTFIHLWDRTGKPLKHFDKLRQRPAAINSLAYVPGKEQEELFYTWSESEAGGAQKAGGAVLNVVRPEASREGPTWEDRVAGARGAISPDGTLAATAGGSDNGVALWTLRDGKPLRRLKGRGQEHYRVGWSPQGRVVGWTDALQPPTNDADLLQRSFTLDQLSFGTKPHAGYLRVSPPRGGYHLQRDGTNYLVKRGKKVISTIKDVGTSYWTWLPGDRVALAYYGRIVLYNALTGEPIRTLGPSSDRVLDTALSPDGRYLLGAGSDQTLRIWDLEGQDSDKPGPLLSLFVAGADWVAWTQEGYYAASPAGERLMGWQVNNGPEKLAAFYPAAQFHKAFYRPDVIRRVLAEGGVAPALAAADKANGTTTATVSVAQALPPEVSILSPAAGKQNQAEVEVKAQAQSKDRPVVTMHLLLDGRPVPGAEAVSFPQAKPGEMKEAAWKVTLPEGEHHLDVLAETDASLGASPEVVVAYQPAAAPAEPLPTLYVLAIGINAYPGSLKLNWAVDDANAVAKAFQADAAPKPYGKVEPQLLTDEKATKEGILAGLDWLKKNMTADDTAVVFYAGHGHRDKKTGQFYMLPQDVDVKDLPGTGVTGKQLKDKLKVVPGRVLLLLDACHSGSIGQSPADPGSLTDDVQRQLAAPDCGVVVMCAAMAQEEAGEAAAVQHGFFTAALLSGLGGGAPPSKDGLIHLTALNFYVEEEVSALSKDEQHVVVDRPSTVTSFPLVRGGGKPDEK